MGGAEESSRVGSQVGQYRVERLLGRGSMSEVYEAEDTVAGRVVALKLLRESLSHDPGARSRLQQAVRLASGLQEPHVVPIHDFGEIDGVFYLAMRLIDGPDLRTMLSREGPLTPARAVAIMGQIASALDAAHVSGIIHRDVKPENILITHDDFAYLGDLGIASATTEEQLGFEDPQAFAYMAPERFHNAEVTNRADIYALACVLHECLTGAQPYPAGTAAEVVTAHLMEPIPRPSLSGPGIPASLDGVISRGMDKVPANRYNSAGDLARAAQEALTAPDYQDARPSSLPATMAAPPSAYHQPLGGFEVSPVATDKFCCPSCDFVWYRPEVGVPVPRCPADSCQLESASALLAPAVSQRGWRRWLPSRRPPRT